MGLHCFLKGHIPVRLAALKNQSVIQISDQTGVLVHIEMCVRCGTLYGKYAQPKAQWEAQDNVLKIVTDGNVGL